MSIQQINTIDQVISALDEIISDSIRTNNTLGYFAVLYRNVTISVKNGIKNNHFDNGPRMEKLDVIFAKRYIDAYYAWQRNEVVTKSWQKAFEISNSYWPIVLQHLLIGMNAHINLDLGIAAAQVSKNQNIGDLENDFKKINGILSALVNKVQNNLSEMWPTLKKILKKTGKVDDFFVDFSMELARDGAWKFAQTIATVDNRELEKMIELRDIKIARKTAIIISPGFWISSVLKTVRLGELGTVATRINQLTTK
jgi:hypothetical protein